MTSIEIFCYEGVAGPKYHQSFQAQYSNSAHQVLQVQVVQIIHHVQNKTCKAHPNANEGVTITWADELHEC
jgi:hypothetical protein